MQMQKKAANAKASKCGSWNSLEYECHNATAPNLGREIMVAAAARRGPPKYSEKIRWEDSDAHLATLGFPRHIADGNVGQAAVSNHITSQ